MRQLPEIKELVDRFAGQPFSIVSVSLDNQYTIDILREMLGESHFPYPVLCQYADTGVYGTYDWETERGIPTSFIIDPQGVVRAELYPGLELVPVLEWLMSADASAPLGLSVGIVQRPDGVFAQISVTSPDHVPLELSIGATQLVPGFSTNGRPAWDPLPIDGADGQVLSLEFDMFGDQWIELPLNLAEDASGLRITAATTPPGWETSGQPGEFIIEATDFVWLDE